MNDARPRSRSLVSAVGIVMLFVSVAAAHGVAQHRANRAQLVRALITLDAAALDGSRWDYDRIRGRVTLVDFWATWCAPCLRELPHLKRARATYGSDFRVLGISLDRMGRGDLTSWLRRHGVEWPQIHADGGYQDSIALAFSIDRLPTNLLPDRHGRVRALDVRGDELFVQVDALLAEDSASD